jgi:hypothetical protein
MFMKIPKNVLKIYIVPLLLVSLSLSVYAQKLPGIQETSVLAPKNIKIDAKLTEWDDTFQAYNKTTEIFYTISNDDKNLYLVIKSTDPINNNKIIAGGINFTINTTGRKKDKEGYVITFPLVDIAAMRNQILSMASTGGAGSNREPDSAAIANMRKKALSMVKEIKLAGFAVADVPDSVVSIYNEYGLKAAIDYDAKGNLTCEMAVPLKYLHLITAGTKELNYNIKLNGLNIDAIFPGAGAFMSGGFGGGGGGAGGGFGGGGGRAGGGIPGGAANGIPSSMQQMQSMISPTDFWGKYTLAKK